MVTAEANSARELEADADLYPAERGEILLEAAGAWRRAGADDRAATVLRSVVELGGEDALYARIELADLHFDHGDEAAGRSELDIIWKDPVLNDGHCVLAAELLEARDDLTGAERWFNRGVALLDPDDLAAAGDPGSFIVPAGMLLQARRRVRRSLGRTPDMLDDRVQDPPARLDDRLRLAAEILDHPDTPFSATPTPEAKAPPRNGPCPCGSGRKYKKCCGRPT